MPRGTDMDAVVLPSTLEEELKHDLKDLSKLDKMPLSEEG